jgi:hypothetical protein
VNTQFIEAFDQVGRDAKGFEIAHSSCGVGERGPKVKAGREAG